MGETRGVLSSRRQALALMLGASAALAAAEAPIRLAISETLVTDVKINDARAAMLIWLKRMMTDLDVVVEFNPKIFETTQEIVRRARGGQLDAVALNVVEYKQLADVLDSSQIIAQAGEAGIDQYFLLAKRNGGIQRIGDLRGRRLMVLKNPKMCVATAWLSTLLEEGHFGQSEQFFGSVTTDTKAARVVLPVFFGQTDACLTSKQGFDTMCELNPQVGKELIAIASSPVMVLTFQIFRKNYRSVNRENFIKVYSNPGASAAGRQLGTLFQFDQMVVKDAACLAPALAILGQAERGRSKPRAGI